MQPQNPRDLLKIGLFANIIEWYEFSIYGLLAGIIGQLFFKSASPISGVISAFAIFALSYLIRPLGSLFFSYFAEKHGRNKSLRVSLMLMSIPTIFIGLLPTYQSIGYWATGLLFALRMIQSFAAGGEFPISACYVFETAPPHLRSILCGLISNSSIIGWLCGSIILSCLFGYFDEHTILSYAWRIPFLLGIPLSLWVYHIRKNIIDYNIPLRSKQNPMTKLLSSEKYPLLQSFCLITFSSVVGVYIQADWMQSHLIYVLHHSPERVYLLITVTECVGILMSLVASALARVFGIRLIMTMSILATLLYVFPLFFALQTASLSRCFFLLLTFKVLTSGIAGVVIEALGSLFTQARALGMSLSFTLAASLMGGTAPFICTYMTQKTGLSNFTAFYVIVLGLIALPVALNFKSPITRELT